jgi:hypothetical protein
MAGRQGSGVLAVCGMAREKGTGEVLIQSRQNQKAGCDRIGFSCIVMLHWPVHLL